MNKCENGIGDLTHEMKCILFSCQHTKEWRQARNVARNVESQSRIIKNTKLKTN